jgi:hypothetical protein
VGRDLILVQYQYNNCTTTPHMRVGPSMWDPPSCEGLLYSCCIDVVNLTFFVWDLPSCEGLLYNCCIDVVNLTFSNSESNPNNCKKKLNQSFDKVSLPEEK